MVLMKFTYIDALIYLVSFTVTFM